MGVHCISVSHIWCGNKSAIELAENPIYHSRTKHIKLYIHFLRDKVLAKGLEINCIPSEEQIPNILTKLLLFIQFNFFKAKLNVQPYLLSLRGQLRERNQIRKVRSSQMSKLSFLAVIAQPC